MIDLFFSCFLALAYIITVILIFTLQQGYIDLWPQGSG